MIDPATIVLQTLNVLACVIIFVIVTWKLVAKYEHFTIIENVGMGLTAAGAIMTIGPITYEHGTPFDMWAGVLMRIGMATYFIGRVTRHAFNNWLARREARRRMGH